MMILSFILMNRSVLHFLSEKKHAVIYLKNVMRFARCVILDDKHLGRWISIIYNEMINVSIHHLIND